MGSASKGAARLSVIPLLLMVALAALELWRGFRGPFAGAAVVTSLLLVAAGLLATWHLASGRGAAAVRRGALLSALITLVLVLNCSATGVSNQQGMGYQLALGAPLVYLGTTLLLVGPLLASLIVTAWLAGRGRAPVVAAIVSGVLALATFEAGLVTSFSGVCSRFGAAAPESACVTAATGALAGLFGLFGVLLVLPVAAGKPPPEPPTPAATGPSD
jgi:hypothetical protein